MNTCDVGGCYIDGPHTHKGASVVLRCRNCGRITGGAYCSNGCDKSAPYPGCPKDGYGRWDP